VGVDEEGKKHVLGLAEGASENQAVAKGLLEDVVRRGVRTDRNIVDPSF
jgi:putative transposase